MMQSSQFADEQSHFEAMEPIDSQGATCDAFVVKLYGKLHFLKRLKPELAGDIRYQEAQRKEFETGYRLEHPRPRTLCLAHRRRHPDGVCRR